MAPGVQSKRAAFFNVGDPITFGKYQNKPGKIVRFLDDGKGNPLIEIEPVPKGLKKNKVMPLFRIRHRKVVMAIRHADIQVAHRRMVARAVERHIAAQGVPTPHVRRSAVKTADSDTSIYKAAVAAYEALPKDLQREVHNFLQGVFTGKAQRLESKADELYEHYESVRAVIRSKHGSSVTLYRGEPKDKPPIKRRFLSWTPSYKLATVFAQDRGYEVVEADVRVGDVFAVLVSPHNKFYVEYLVKSRPEYHGKGQALPLQGAVFFIFEDGDFSVARAQAEALHIEEAIRDAKGRVLNVRINEEDEGLVVSVLLPPDTPVRPNDETTAVIGPYVVEALGPFAEGLHKGSATLQHCLAPKAELEEMGSAEALNRRAKDLSKGESHKEANRRIAFNIVGRFVARGL